MFCTGLNAQQIPHLQHNLFLPNILNPATQGLGGYTSISLIDRMQWMGFENGPTTYHLSFQTGLSKVFGLGSNLSYDNSGPFKRLSLTVAPSAHFRLSDQSTFSVGFNLGVLNYGVNYTDIIERIKIARSKDDPILMQGGPQSHPKLDAGIGLHYQYENGLTRFRFGLNTSQLPSMQETDADRFIFGAYTHLFANTSFQFPISEQNALEFLFLYQNITGSFSRPPASETFGAAIGGGELDGYFRFVAPAKNNFWIGAGVGANIGKADSAFQNGRESINAINLGAGLDISDRLGLNLFFGKRSGMPVSGEIGLTFYLTRPNKNDCSILWRYSRCLQERIDMLQTRPVGASGTSIIDQRSVTLRYIYADESDIYDLNNAEGINAFVEQVVRDVNQIKDTPGRDGLQEIESIKLRIFLRDNVNILNSPSFIDYDGSLGDQVERNYSLDGQKQTDSINKGDGISRKDLAFLKAEAVRQLLRVRQVTSSETSIEMNSGLEIDFFRQYVIEIRFRR